MSVVLENTVDCPECDTMFDHVFTTPDGVEEREDMIDAPVEEVECPECGHRFERAWEGWFIHEDAG